ncbi:MAG: sigma-54-dependent Fis family transcriptional regulator, partial [Planctomycetes bacterium]|nr:sigma-54-dependent Fis family transcriptional regulator [Planctomycetota bacterium]
AGGRRMADVERGADAQVRGPREGGGREAARMLGVGEASLYRAIRRFGLPE